MYHHVVGFRGHGGRKGHGERLCTWGGVAARVRSMRSTAWQNCLGVLRGFSQRGSGPADRLDGVKRSACVRFVCQLGVHADSLGPARGPDERILCRAQSGAMFAATGTIRSMRRHHAAQSFERHLSRRIGCVAMSVRNLDLASATRRSADVSSARPGH